eukprot:2753085-Pleurochrysis_carterae.AAC.1
MVGAMRSTRFVARRKCSNIGQRMRARKTNVVWWRQIEQEERRKAEKGSDRERRKSESENERERTRERERENARKSAREKELSLIHI